MKTWGSKDPTAVKHSRSMRHSPARTLIYATRNAGKGEENVFPKMLTGTLNQVIFTSSGLNK